MKTENTHSIPLSHDHLLVNDISMHVVHAGEGNPILFLHGFPDYWGVWQGLMDQFVSTHHVIAPDLRGYGETSRPRLLEAYKPRVLTKDVLDLIETMDLNKVTLVGHDWGATLAFWVALSDASRIDKLVIFNGAHPYIMQDRIWDDPIQRKSSQYMQLLSSEAGNLRFNHKNAHMIAEQWLSGPLASGKLSQREYNKYIELWSDSDAWPAMLNWYRAATFSIPGVNELPPAQRWTDGLDYRIDRPVAVIWGDQDGVFTSDLAYDLEPHVASLNITHLPDAGHVPQRDCLKSSIDVMQGLL